MIELRTLSRQERKHAHNRNRMFKERKKTQTNHVEKTRRDLRHGNEANHNVRTCSCASRRQSDEICGISMSFGKRFFFIYHFRKVLAIAGVHHGLNGLTVQSTQRRSSYNQDQRRILETRRVRMMDDTVLFKLHHGNVCNIVDTTFRCLRRFVHVWCLLSICILVRSAHVGMYGDFWPTLYLSISAQHEAKLNQRCRSTRMGSIFMGHAVGV